MNQALGLYVLRIKLWAKWTKSLPLHSAWKRSGEKKKKKTQKIKIYAMVDGHGTHEEAEMEEAEWGWSGGNLQC